jgi:hypothetical protein
MQQVRLVSVSTSPSRADAISRRIQGVSSMSVYMRRARHRPAAMRHRPRKTGDNTNRRKERLAGCHDIVMPTTGRLIRWSA